MQSLKWDKFYRVSRRNNSTNFVVVSIISTRIVQADWLQMNSSPVSFLWVIPLGRIDKATSISNVFWLLSIQITLATCSSMRSWTLWLANLQTQTRLSKLSIVSAYLPETRFAYVFFETISKYYFDKSDNRVIWFSLFSRTSWQTNWGGNCHLTRPNTVFSECLLTKVRIRLLVHWTIVHSPLLCTVNQICKDTYQRWKISGRFPFKKEKNKKKEIKCSHETFVARFGTSTTSFIN